MEGHADQGQSPRTDCLLFESLEKKITKREIDGFMVCDSLDYLVIE